jgi:hypothetical protein
MKITEENKSRDNLFTFGTISEVEISESSHGLPHTDSAQSFGPVFNLQDYIPEITKGSFRWLMYKIRVMIVSLVLVQLVKVKVRIGCL